MFDLNKAVAEWRHSLAEAANIGDEELDELESHLFDEMDQLASAGLLAEEAFQQAVARLGDIGKLNREFSKVRTEDSGLIKIIEGEVLAMSFGKTFHGERFVMLLLFVGFCGVIGWLGTTWWVLDNTNFRGADFWQTLIIIGNRSLWCSFFLIFALIGIPWGLRLLRQSELKMKLVIRSLIPAAVLSPAYILMGMVIILSTPFVYACFRTAVAGPNVVQSVLSPDERFEAYVVDKPSFDPPNHHLYIHRNDVNFSKEIAKLPADVDFIQRIYWSPHSDIVVFQTYFKLIAVRLPDCKKAEVTFGGGLQWRKNGTSWVDYKNVKHAAAVEFPKPGSFSYRLDDSAESKIIEMDSL
jgi:hypothetical protein